MTSQLLDLLARAKVYELAQPYYVGMPHHPVHPPYTFAMSKAHGEYMRGDVSSAAEAISLGGHVGTHIDALCHFSKAGKFHGGVAVEQSYGKGVAHWSVDTIQPILRRGVMLDIARHRDAEVLPVDFEIDARTIQDAAREQGVAIRAGDVVLIRTGWARYWGDAAKFISEVRCPGPNLEAAEFLSSCGIFAAGSDTVAFEFVPSKTMPVHVHLLVEKGIHIVEALNLERLAADRVTEFVFIAMPLKLTGGTGAPICPIAVV